MPINECATGTDLNFIHLFIMLKTKLFPLFREENVGLFCGNAMEMSFKFRIRIFQILIMITFHAKIDQKKTLTATSLPKN